LGLAISFVLLSFFLKNFDFSKVFLDSLDGIVGGILVTSIYLFFFEDLILLTGLLMLIFLIFRDKRNKLLGGLTKTSKLWNVCFCVSL